MATLPLRIATIVSAPFDENTYIVNLSDRNDCLIVDPGFDTKAIFRYVDQQQLTPAAILNTHGHADHIAGNWAMKQRWPDCPLVIGRGDATKLVDADENLSAGFGIPVTSPPADQLVDDGQAYQWGGIQFEVHEIPGHSAGHVVFICREQSPAIVLGGDVLFASSVGRTDFPGGSFAALRDGIHRHLFTLADDTQVYPGHGPMTTIGRERRTNPFVGEGAER